MVGSREIFFIFFKLGCTSFGGPIAHIAYFHAEFVARRHWISDQQFGELLALCQFLPGPTSSQLAFALGYERAGFKGALGASLGFLLPSASVMTTLGFFLLVSEIPSQSVLLDGLKIAAVAVVAQAIWSMGRSFCFDRRRLAICALAALALTFWQHPAAQLGVIAASGLTGACILRRSEFSLCTNRAGPAIQTPSLVCLAIFASLFVLSAVDSNPAITVFSAFYRAGALVFGGGHVVLPLLQAEIIPRGWISHDQFLAGYSAVQAMPGPLFSFVGYLGAFVARSTGVPLAAFIGLFGIFLPGWLLVAGFLPYWKRIQATGFAAPMLQGINAGVVGILLAAFYSPILGESIHSLGDLGLGLSTFIFLQFRRIPVWFVIAGCVALRSTW